MKLLIDMPRFEPGISAIACQSGLEIEFVETPATEARPLPRHQLAETEVLFCTIPPENLSEMKRLRWIQIASVGYSQLFGLGLAERAIAVTNASGCFDVPIAEWNVAMMINLSRDLPQMLRNQSQRTWDRSARFQNEIRGLTVGLWGYGGIGRETARLARALGMRVHVLTRSGTVPPRENVYAVDGTGDPHGEWPHRLFGPATKAEFLRDLDFLIVATPLTHATEGMIGEAELRALPRRAFLLNPARGPIVQQSALLRALTGGWIAGAALDTHYQYPMPPEHPLWGFPHVIFTPHISGSSLSPHFQQRLWHIFAENVARFTSGAPLLNRLTPQQLRGN